MSVGDFETRLGDLMMRVMADVRSGTTAPSDEVLARLAGLEAELAQAMSAMADPSLLAEVAQGVAAFRDTVTNPAIFSAMAESLSTPSDPDPELFDAILDDDVEAVRALLPGYPINSQHGTYRASALYKAMSTMFGVSVRIIDLLLDAGADPRIGLGDGNVLGGLGFGRCDGVAPEDLARVIRRCVDLGADLEQRSDRLFWTPLITAASEWNAVAVEALLMAGADITAKAGEFSGAFGAGADSFAFAEGSPETLAVLTRYAGRN